MGGQVPVAEAEPVGLHAVAGQLLHGVPGFVAVPPAALGIDAAAQGVHAGVQVGADADPVHPGVVADVDDCGQFVRGGPVVRCGFGELAQTQQFLDAEQEPGAADPPTRTVTFTAHDSTVGAVMLGVADRRHRSRQGRGKTRR